MVGGERPPDRDLRRLPRRRRCSCPSPARCGRANERTRWAGTVLAVAAAVVAVMVWRLLQLWEATGGVRTGRWGRPRSTATRAQPAAVAPAGCWSPSTARSPWPRVRGRRCSSPPASTRRRWPTCCRRSPPWSTSWRRSAWSAAGPADGGSPWSRSAWSWSASWSWARSRWSTARRSRTRRCGRAYGRGYCLRAAGPARARAAAAPAEVRSPRRSPLPRSRRRSPRPPESRRRSRRVVAPAVAVVAPVGLGAVLVPLGVGLLVAAAEQAAVAEAGVEERVGDRACR